MLKSIGVVVGSYLLSVVLVLATDPLLSRLFPGDFVNGRVPSDNALMASTAMFVVISIFCAWVCARFARARGAACAVVLYSGRGDGPGRDRSQLEQGLAALVLAVVADHVAGELLDRPAAGGAADGYGYGVLEGQERKRRLLCTTWSQSAVLVTDTAKSVKGVGVAIAFLAVYSYLGWLPQPHAF
jgi:hypothetical protein